MRTPLPLPSRARPWSPLTDWPRSAAVRALHALRQHKVAVHGSLQVAPQDRGAFPEGPQVLAVHRGTPPILRSDAGHSMPVQRIDDPAGSHEAGPFQILVFHDGSGLVLRHLVMPHHDLLNLPVLPFVWEGTSPMDAFDPTACWKPVSTTPRSTQAQADALAHARLFPRWHSLEQGAEVEAAQDAFLARVACLQQLYLWVPDDMDLYGGCGDTGPHLSWPHGATAPKDPLWPALQTALNALAGRMLPGLLGLSQRWDPHTPDGDDPRVPQSMRRVPLDSDTPFSAHRRLALHQALWGVAAGPWTDAPHA